MENKWFEIPLSYSNQTFDIYLGKDKYIFTIVWRECDSGGQWFLDIADEKNKPLVAGRPLIPEMDLLDGFQYLGIGQLVVMLDGHEDRLPRYNELGTKAKLYWSPYE